MSNELITFLKIVIIVLLLLLLIFPLLPFKINKKKIKTTQGLKYISPHNKKNFPYTFLLIGEFILLAILSSVLISLADLILKIPFVGQLINNVKSAIGVQNDYFIFVILIFILNIIIIYGTLLLKFIFKKFVLDPIFKFSKRKKFSFKSLILSIKKRRKEKAEKRYEKAKAKKEKKNKVAPSKIDVPTKEEDIDENDEKEKNVGEFEHTKKEAETKNENDEKEEDAPFEEDEIKNYIRVNERKFIGLFFEREGGYVYVYPYVARLRKILSCFIYIVEALYILLFLLLLISIFFPLDKGFYDFFVNVMRIKDWYIYPFISILILQEIVNTLNAPCKPIKLPEEEKEEEEIASKAEVDLHDLKVQLVRYFDSEHTLRFYPEAKPKEIKEYKYTSIGYASALDFIKTYMKNSSGKVVENYIEIIDNLFGDNNIYYSGSMFSEFGEYLIAYTFARLISGSRLIFIISDSTKKEYLREFISKRLTKLSGIFGKSVWRVRTSDEELDQTDVLVASPDDFISDSLVANNDVFFEELINAIFIDCDRMIEMQNYLCTIMSMRMKDASKRRLSFIFLSDRVYRGLSNSSLPKLFNVENILSYTNAKENEEVSYIIMNKESANQNRIYNFNGQKLTDISCVIAKMAYEHDVDGIKLISKGQIDHAVRKTLQSHGIEINKFYKEVPNINYIIYDDDGYNLASSLYLTTRFRGKFKSIVTIISKPYLLREYFMYKVESNDYINRSPFIQPHINAVINPWKLCLLKLYLSCTGENGILIKDFEEKCRVAFSNPVICYESEENKFCKTLREKKQGFENMNYEDFASYLIAGLCDKFNNENNELSYGLKAKDYYIISNRLTKNRATWSSEKEQQITFKNTNFVFEKILSRNVKVNLYLNDKIIGYLDTFPERVSSEYVKGQSIYFNNTEYEIEDISSDHTSIFLRHENVVFQNTYDTIFLKRFKNVRLIEKIKNNDDIIVYSKGVLEELRVNRYKVSFVGETYGYYSLMSSNQTLDLFGENENSKGSKGNPIFSNELINDKKCQRNIKGYKAIKLTLKSREKVNDKMRLLLSAVFNEFIKTLFPHAYNCVCIAPLLEEAISPLGTNEKINTFTDRVRRLYPFIYSDLSNEEIEKEGVLIKETSDKEMTFIFFNDCSKDIGVLEWFDDQFGHYMEEFIANAYSYLHWLDKNSMLKHYIYFGSNSLPTCYDLKSCVELLKEFNYVISDEGKKDYETANKDEIYDSLERCSFCHHILESGRYTKFDDTRLICNNCINSSVYDLETLNIINQDMVNYLALNYPEIIFGNQEIKFMDPLKLDKDHLLSENLYMIDVDNNIISVERDDPAMTIEVSIIRGKIEFWQLANQLSNHYAVGQLYYEEILYLRKKGHIDQAKWVYDTIKSSTREIVDEISLFTGIFVNEKYNKDAVNKIDENGDRCTSFSYLRRKSEELKNNPKEVDDKGDEEGSDDLYDPNKTPRFWKREIYDKKGEEEDLKTPDPAPIKDDLDVEIPSEEEIDEQNISDETSNDDDDDNGGE